MDHRTAAVVTALAAVICFAYIMATWWDEHTRRVKLETEALDMRMQIDALKEMLICEDSLLWYEKETRRTYPKLTRREGQLLGAIGIVEEAGEAAGVIKKVLFHGHIFSQDRLCTELGDVLWYLTYLARVSGLSLAEVAGRNVQKLHARYPDGWDPERSRNRTQ